MLLGKLEVLFRKKGSWLYLTKRKREKTYLNIQLIWLKHSMKMMTFLKKCLEKKDYVSVSSNTYKQKRLILSNLNELYANFKSKCVSTSIGFSKFYELCPKWCILARSSGTHSMCV